MKRVAVMQPYFFPYAGYFRLFAAVDEFVIFDCVQFPQRGRVHRTEVTGSRRQAERWLTLPLAQHSRATRIQDLRFAADARRTLDRRLARLDWIAGARGPAADRVRSVLFAPLVQPVADYLEAALRLAVEVLDLRCVISRSSELHLPPELRGQSRVIAVAKGVGATGYVNAPGGRSLYDRDTFAQHQLSLEFLTPYQGPFRHMLSALMTLEPAQIRDDIMATSDVVPS